MDEYGCVDGKDDGVLLLFGGFATPIVLVLLLNFTRFRLFVILFVPLVSELCDDVSSRFAANVFVV